MRIIRNDLTPKWAWEHDPGGQEPNGAGSARSPHMVVTDWIGSIIVELAAGDDPVDAQLVIAQAFDDSVENVVVTEWDVITTGNCVTAIPGKWMATI